MKTAQANLHFPVMAFTTDADIWGLPDLDRLTKCGPRTLKEGKQIGMEIIDSQGSRWNVREVRRVGRTGSLLMVLLTGVPQSRIEQELEILPTVSLEEIKARVVAAIEAHPDFWVAWGDDDAELPEILAGVRGTTSFAELYGKLGLDTFEPY